MKRFFLAFIFLLSQAGATPDVPAINYYHSVKYRFGFWFVAEQDRAGQTNAQVQYSLEVIESRTGGWFRPIAPLVVAPGSVISFETVYGDGVQVFTRMGFARIVAEWITPTPKVNRNHRGWVILQPIQY